MGCRDGDTVCIDIGETRGDGVWEKRISVETGVGGCDSIAACMDVQSTWWHYGYRSISGGI